MHSTQRKGGKERVKVRKWTGKEEREKEREDLQDWGSSPFSAADFLCNLGKVLSLSVSHFSICKMGIRVLLCLTGIL